MATDTLHDADIETRTINTIRFLAADAVQRAESGHPGTPMALAPVAYTLWTRHLRHSPEPGRIGTGLSCLQATPRCFCTASSI